MHCCVTSVAVVESCLTLCDPMDGSAPDSSLHGIFRVKNTGQLTITFSRGSSQPMDWTCISCKSSALQAGSLPLSCRGSPGETQHWLLHADMGWCNTCLFHTHTSSPPVPYLLLSYESNIFLMSSLSLSFYLNVIYMRPSLAISSKLSILAPLPYFFYPLTTKIIHILFMSCHSHLNLSSPRTGIFVCLICHYILSARTMLSYRKCSRKICIINESLFMFSELLS